MVFAFLAIRETVGDREGSHIEDHPGVLASIARKFVMAKNVILSAAVEVSVRLGCVKPEGVIVNTSCNNKGGTAGNLVPEKTRFLFL